MSLSCPFWTLPFAGKMILSLLAHAGGNKDRRDDGTAQEKGGGERLCEQRRGGRRTVFGDGDRCERDWAPEQGPLETLPTSRLIQRTVRVLYGTPSTCLLDCMPSVDTSSDGRENARHGTSEAVLAARVVNPPTRLLDRKAKENSCRRTVHAPGQQRVGWLSRISNPHVPVPDEALRATKYCAVPPTEDPELASVEMKQRRNEPVMQISNMLRRASPKETVHMASFSLSRRGSGKTALNLSKAVVEKCEAGCDFCSRVLLLPEQRSRPTESCNWK